MFCTAWSGYLTAGQTVVVGSPSLPNDVVTVLGIFTKPRTDLGHPVSIIYENELIYGYSPNYTGEFIYDVIIVYD